MMKKTKLVQLTGLVVLFFIAMMSCNQESAKSNKDADQEILKMVQVYENAYNNKDASAISMLFTRDGSQWPPGADMVKGRDNIAKLLQGAFNQGATNLHIKPISFEVKGDIGYGVGTFKVDVPIKDGKMMTRTGKYASILNKNAKGKWLIMYHIYNFDLPLPIPTPPNDSTSAPASKDGM